MTEPEQIDRMGAGQSQNRKRLLLIALLAVFLSPVIGAWLWTPDSFRNQGELIEPPRPLVSVPMVSPDGALVELKTLLGKWTFVYFIGGTCDSVCRQTADSLERVRLSQGKNARRLRVLAIVLSPTQLSAASQLRLDTPETIVLGVSAEKKRRLVSQFSLGSDAPTDGKPRIYLVDPLGNLMMSYPVDADPSDLRKDIGRLLRASRVG